MKLKRFILQEDKIMNEPLADIIPYEDFLRKGSNLYGGLVKKMMEWIRLYKKEGQDEVRAPYQKFLAETKIDPHAFTEYLADKKKNISAGISFDIELNGSEIIFSNLERSNQEDTYLESKN